MAEKKTTAAKKTTATKATAAKKTTSATKRTTAATATKKTTAARAAAAPVAAAPAPVKRVALKGISKRTTVRKAPSAAAGESAKGTAPKTHRRTQVGMVVSAKMAKTVIVEVERQRQHPLYRKALRVGKRFAAHTENGDVLAGDLVRIQESRPFSATKRWRVIEVISRAGEAGAAAPRVADVEQQLEETEGVTEIFATAKADSAEEALGAGEKSPEGDTKE